jgi:hypothetical protein
MTDLSLLLPRANAPIAGNLPASREFYDFLRELLALAGQQTTDGESIEELAARVLALENAENESPAEIIGLGSVLVTGSLAAGRVTIELTSDPFAPCSASATFKGGDADIEVGTFCDLSVPNAFVINGVTLVGEPSGSIEIDIRGVNISSFPPGPSDTICGGTPPALVAASTYQDTTLTGWTLTVPANHVLRFVVNSCSGVSSANLVISGNRTNA